MGLEFGMVGFPPRNTSVHRKYQCSMHPPGNKVFTSLPMANICNLFLYKSSKFQAFELYLHNAKRALLKLQSLKNTLDVFTTLCPVKHCVCFILKSVQILSFNFTLSDKEIMVAK